MEKLQLCLQKSKCEYNARNIQNNLPINLLHYWLHRNILPKTIVPVIPECYVFHYKHDVNYKGLLWIASSGTSTFISELYEGSISGKEIVKRSVILNKNLWDDNDSIMAGWVFTTQNELAPLNWIFLHYLVAGLSQLEQKSKKVKQ